MLELEKLTRRYNDYLPDVKVSEKGMIGQNFKVNETTHTVLEVIPSSACRTFDVCSPVPGT